MQYKLIANNTSTKGVILKKFYFKFLYQFCGNVNLIYCYLIYCYFFSFNPIYVINIEDLIETRFS